MKNIEQVYNDYSKTIYKFLLYLTRDYHISEELTQETFCIAIKNISKLDEISNIRTWLCQVAKNLWYKELNKKRKYNVIAIDDDIEKIPIIDDFTEGIIIREEKQQLYKKIEELGSPLAELVKMRAMMNFSFQEIGEILNKSEVWARVNYYRAKQKIKGDEKSEIL